MAEEHGGGGTNPVFFLAALVAGVFVLWVAGGGPARYMEEQRNLAGNRDATISSTTSSGISYTDMRNDLRNTQDNYTKTKEQLEEAKIWGAESPFKDAVEFDNSISGAKATNKKGEYVRIRVKPNTKSSIDITGWSLESYVTGEKEMIGNGVVLPRVGHTNRAERIVLNPGDSATLATGESPIGISFQENMCSGYLTQFQTFAPTMDIICPYPKDEIVRNPYVSPTDDTCYDFVDTLPRCKVVLDVPSNIGSACRDFIDADLTYNGCVDNHLTDTNFFGSVNDWRIFLDADSELWRTEREIIKLVDAEGRTVDVLEY